jgi:hypothetical protein
MATTDVDANARPRPDGRDESTRPRPHVDRAFATLARRLLPERSVFMPLQTSFAWLRSFAFEPEPFHW